MIKIPFKIAIWIMLLISQKHISNQILLFASGIMQKSQENKLLLYCTLATSSNMIEKRRTTQEKEYFSKTETGLGNKAC